MKFYFRAILTQLIYNFWNQIFVEKINSYVVSQGDSFVPLFLEKYVKIHFRSFHDDLAVYLTLGRNPFIFGRRKFEFKLVGHFQRNCANISNINNKTPYYTLLQREKCHLLPRFSKVDRRMQAYGGQKNKPAGAAGRGRGSSRRSRSRLKNNISSNAVCFY